MNDRPSLAQCLRAGVEFTPRQLSDETGYSIPYIQAKMKMVQVEGFCQRYKSGLNGGGWCYFIKPFQLISAKATVKTRREKGENKNDRHENHPDGLYGFNNPFEILFFQRAV